MVVIWVDQLSSFEPFCFYGYNINGIPAPAFGITVWRCQNGKHVYISFQEHRKGPVEVATPPKNPRPKPSTGPKRSKSNKPLTPPEKPASQPKLKIHTVCFGVLDNQKQTEFQKASKINGWLYVDYRVPTT